MKEENDVDEGDGERRQRRETVGKWQLVIATFSDLKNVFERNLEASKCNS
jgi:hypothetical protein